MEKKLVQISVTIRNFNDPVNQFTKILKMIDPKDIKEAFVRTNQIITAKDDDVDNWNLHLYTDDTRISFQDAVVGYDGDSPRGKTYKILTMAGFNVSIDDIIFCKQDFTIKK